MDDCKQIRLFVGPDVKAVLEKRRLKDEELQKTVSQAEKTGQKFVHPLTGRFLAGVRQGSATVWVEYGPREDGYEIYSAYQHRVEISAWDFKTGHTR
jgi:glutamate synthase (NADPH) small chain